MRFGRRALMLSLGIHLGLFLGLQFLFNEPPFEVASTEMSVSIVRTLTPRPVLRRNAVDRASLIPTAGSTMPHEVSPKLVAVPISTEHPVGRVALPLAMPLGEGLPKGPATLPSSGIPSGTVTRPFALQPVPLRYRVPVYRREENRLELLDSAGQPLRLPQSPLERIALHAMQQPSGKTVDLFFLIDGSQSMEDNIRAVILHLNGMIETFVQSGVDVRIGAAVFRHSTFLALMGWDLDILQPTRDFGRIRRMLAGIECIGDERALDALQRVLKRVRFRKGSQRRLVLITDEYVSGRVSMTQLIQEVVRRRVHVDVIGRDEPFQHWLAEQTHGIWQPIEGLFP